MGESEAVRLSGRTRRQVGSAMLGTVLALLCATLLLTDAAGPGLLFGTVFFGVGSAVVWWRVASPPELILDQDGFTYRGFLGRRPRRVGWASVRGPFHVLGARGSEFIAFDVDRGGDGQRIGDGTNRAVTGFNASIPGDGLGRPAVEVARLMNAYLEGAESDPAGAGD